MVSGMIWRSHTILLLIGPPPFVCKVEACMRHPAHLMTGPSQKWLAGCMVILALKRSSSCIWSPQVKVHCAYAIHPVLLLDGIQMPPEKDSSCLPSHAWIHFFQTPIEIYSTSMLLKLSFFFFFSLFKLKTNLFDLEFQNQSFMVLIHGIWHFTVNSSC